MKESLKNTFALYISSSAIVALELRLKNKALSVSQFKTVSLPAGVIEDDCIVVNPEAFKEKLQELLKEDGQGSFDKKNVILSFPEGKTFSHQLTVPKSQIGNGQFVAAAAKDYIPIDLNTAISDYQVFSVDSDEAQINFVAAQKSFVQPIIDILENLKLKVLFVDYHNNSLIRLGRYSARSNEDLLIVNIEVDETLVILHSQKGNSFSGNLKISGQDCLQALKADKKISFAQAHQMLFDPKTSDANKVLEKTFDKLYAEITRFIESVKSQQSIDPKQICIIGPYAQVVGLKPFLQSKFKSYTTINPYDFIQSPSGQIYNLPVAVGLALINVSPIDLSREINLLPGAKKQMISYYLMTPIVKQFLMVTTFALGVLVVTFGFLLANTYIDLKISEKEVQISLEKSESPYLLQTAKKTQEQAQLANQVGKILSSNLPFYDLIKKLDSFNGGAIKMLSLNFNLANVGSAQKLRLRSQIDSRADTENFISRLEADAFFEKVISPLSNLTGKGERFVNVDIEIDPQKINEMVADEKEGGLSIPKLPGNN